MYKIYVNMFVNLHLDTGNCFSVSVSLLENIKPFNTDTKNRAHLRTHNNKHFSKKRFNESERTNISHLVLEPKKRSFELEVENGKVHAKCSTKCVKEVDNNFKAKKVLTKCSTKRVSSYGGQIPEILRALDEISDIDEALKPWEESLNNKERTIILKEQTNWERALKIFEYFDNKGGHELNVIHYNIILRTLGAALQWTHVASLWEDMFRRRISPINSTYATLIGAYNDAGLTKESLIWLAKMFKQGLKPDEVTMNVVFQLYKDSGEYLKAGEIFEKWSKKIEGGFSSSNSYNSMIDAYGKAGRIEDAAKIFSLMLEKGISPNTVTFNTMIHVTGTYGSFEEVESLVKKMEELRCPPSARTFNTLISLCGKRDDIDSATRHFRAMREARLEPDIVTYRTLLYAYSIRKMVGEAEELLSEIDSKGLVIDEFTQSALTRMYIEAGEIEKSWVWFERFHLLGNMSSECYSANIDAYGEQGFVLKAEKVFFCCRESKKLSAVVFNVMIKAYGIVKRFCEARDLFDSMKSHGVEPDKCSFTSLIQILAGAELPTDAVPYLRKMRNSGFVADCVYYCMVISSFAKLGDLEKAESLYNEMIWCDIEPDIIVFGTLIDAFAKLGSVEKATSFVGEMKRLGISGNAVIYSSLIKLYTKVGDLEKARETYNLLLRASTEKEEEEIITYSSNCMIDLYSKRSMVGPAEEIFDGLRRKGVANEFAYAMMICLYKNIGRFDDAVAIARQMRDLGLITDLLSYNNAISLYASCGRYNDIIATFDDMLKTTSLEPDDCTFKSLASVLVKSGVSKMAVAKLDKLRKKDPKNEIPKWVKALRFVVQVNGYNVDSDNDS